MGRGFEPRILQELGMNSSKIVWKAKDRNEFEPVDTHGLINGEGEGLLDNYDGY